MSLDETKPIELADMGDWRPDRACGTLRSDQIGEEQSLGLPTQDLSTDNFFSELIRRIWF